MFVNVSYYIRCIVRKEFVTLSTIVFVSFSLCFELLPNLFNNPMAHELVTIIIHLKM